MNTTDQELVDKVAALEIAPPGSYIQTTIAEAMTRLTSLSRDNERMARALKPFAKKADEITKYEAEKATTFAADSLISVQLGHLRAASAIADLSPPQREPLTSQKLIEEGKALLTAGNLVAPDCEVKTTFVALVHDLEGDAWCRADVLHLLACQVAVWTEYRAYGKIKPIAEPSQSMVPNLVTILHKIKGRRVAV